MNRVEIQKILHRMAISVASINRHINEDRDEDEILDFEDILPNRDIHNLIYELRLDISKIEAATLENVDKWYDGHKAKYPMEEEKSDDS